MNAPVIHNFKTQNAYSQQPDDEAFWSSIYSKQFPGFVGFILNNRNNAAQHMGIDRVIFLDNGQTFRIDEKKRPLTRGDILLEYISNDRTGTPGWIEKDLPIDFIAYAFMDTRTAYLLPWHFLRRAWRENKSKWLKEADDRTNGFSKVPGKNPTYTTWSVAVPVNALYFAINRASIACDVDAAAGEVKQ